MTQEIGFQKWVGITAIVAGILAITSLLVGLSGVSYDFEVFSDTSSLIAIGAQNGRLVQWSYWLNMFGNYLLLIPLALWFYSWLPAKHRDFARLLTVCGLFYLLLGAIGSAMLAAGIPLLINLYEGATSAQQANLVLSFQIVNALAEDGVHGIVQNVLAVVWLLGLGSLIRPQQQRLGWATIALGIFLLLNTLGNLFAVEALSLLGLTANIVLGPLWVIWLGILLVQQKL